MRTLLVYTDSSTLVREESASLAIMVINFSKEDMNSTCSCNAIIMLSQVTLMLYKLAPLFLRSPVGRAAVLEPKLYNDSLLLPNNSIQQKKTKTKKKLYDGHTNTMTTTTNMSRY